MKKQIKITETILRDAHQSLIATRMKTSEMLPIVEKLDEVGYFSLEMWGGATFDVCLRFLKEDPWERLRELRKKIKKTKLEMLLRGQNIVGYRNYPDDILHKFIELAKKNGIDVFRIFDAVNDIRNMEAAIKKAKEVDGIVKAAISYTISPIHTIEEYVKLAKEFKQLGADIISIKDMAGILPPKEAYELVKALKEEIGLPVHLHCHCSSGMAPITYMEAIKAGCDIIDTAISPFAWGTSQPPTESIVGALKGTEYDTGLDLNLLNEIAEYFKEIKKNYKIDEVTQMVDPQIITHQIPGGMMSNLLSQLKEQNALDKLDEVLKETERVRADLGYPPLVTPTSQMVGTQAVFNVVLGERYKTILKEVKDYIKGLYGRPPGKIDKRVKRLAIGDEESIKCRPADLLEPEFEKCQLEMKEISSKEEDIISYALFPEVTKKFFEEKNKIVEVEEKPMEKKIVKEEPTSFTFDKLKLKWQDTEYYAELKKIEDDNVIITLNSDDYIVEVTKIDDVTQLAKVNNISYKVELKDFLGNTLKVRVDGQDYEIAIETLREEIKVTDERISPPKPIKKEEVVSAVEKGTIVAPMSGRIIKILVSEGEEVKEKDLLLTIEAMKMENEVTAPFSGKVKKIFVKEGATVQAKEVLLIIT